MPLNLTDFLNTGAHPYAAELPLGGGNKLALTYRAQDAERCRAAILDATREGFQALGFDPAVALKAAVGQMPKGDALTAFQSALDPLDAAGEDAYNALMQKALGASLADVVGTFTAVLPNGTREPLTDPLDADACASLPEDVKRAILQLAMSAALPAEKLSFLGK